MKRIAIIPAYEPDERMLSLLREAEAQKLSLIVVDDGSGETYRTIFEHAKESARVISYADNQGKGAALKKAFAYVRENEKPPFTVVTMDCDGQHRVGDALRLCRLSEKHPHTLILGSRKQSKSSPLRSRLGNGITRKVFVGLTGVPVYDTQTGLRAFDDSLLTEMLNVEGERYEYEMNVLLEFARRKIPMQEITVETIYLDRNAGSHFCAVSDSVRICKELLKFSASSFVGFLVDYSLYSMLLLLFGRAYLLPANVLARLVSATVNFSLNRRYVFRDKGSLWKSAAKYALLAAGILCCNSLVLYVLAQNAGINVFAAKLLTELLLFLVSWVVQRRLIFIGRRRGKDEMNET
ncbi:MAG: bifunctional glycosyltransferase family 2/GtrA family protein [Lachnospiraceae bacterium]|nr:bifunctional glycosyltransferase family 2/GtrA family protein [Lachnospiraceae bacterium]